MISNDADFHDMKLWQLSDTYDLKKKIDSLLHVHTRIILIII